MNIEDDVNVWFIINVAVEYSIGRRSYAPSAVTDFVIRHWDKIPQATKENIRQKVNSAFELDQRTIESGCEFRYLGDDCDVQTWEDFRKFITENV